MFSVHQPPIFSHFLGICLCSPFISVLFFSFPGHIPMFSFHQAHICSHFQGIFLCSPFISLLFFSFPSHIPMFSFHQAPICSHFQGIILCFLLSSASYLFSFPGHIPMFSFHPPPIFLISRAYSYVLLSSALELGQMVSISKYRDTTWFRYQTFKVSKYRLDSSIISLYLEINTYFGI